MAETVTDDVQIQKALADIKKAAESNGTSGGGLTSGSTTESLARVRMLGLRIKMDILSERLSLELGMQYMITRMPICCAGTLAFIVGIFVLFPVGMMTEAHQHIIAHYGLDSGVSSITNGDGIYTFIERFEAKNAELQATSWRYWCEERYFEHVWDSSLRLPVKRCKSPRLYSLGLDTANTSAYSEWIQTHTMSESSTNCGNDDAGLADRMGEPGATCATAIVNQHDVCDTTLGLLFCKGRCGFCSPFNYKRYHKFGNTQVSLLPTIVHQTRRKTKACENFALSYENQRPNPDLNYLPALDGVRTDAILQCLDIGEMSRDTHANHLKCAAGTTSDSCSTGSVDYSPSSMFQNTVIYPLMVAEPAKDILTMREAGWIDGETAEVVVSAILFTEGTELFSSVLVTFDFEPSGNVNVHRKISSMRALSKQSQTVFSTAIGIACGFEFIAMLLAIYNIVKDRVFTFGFHLFEVIATITFFLYSLSLLVTYYLLPSIEAVAVNLLNSFLNYVPSASSDGLNQYSSALTEYFKAKETFASDGAWLHAHRILSCLVLYMQFFLVMMYTGLHPRVGNVTLVIFKAGDHLTHLGLVFMCLFSFLAVLSFWTLGSHASMFATIQDAYLAQFRHLFGEELDDDIFRHFDTPTLIMFQVYYFSFVFFMLMMLVNLFVAIMVDALVQVKREATTKLSDRNVVIDLVDTLSTWSLYRYHKWPGRRTLLKVLDSAVKKEEEDDDEQDTQTNAQESTNVRLYNIDTSSRFREAVGEDFFDFPEFLLHYISKCPSMLVTERDGENRRGSMVQGLDELVGAPSAADLRLSLAKIKEESKEARRRYKEVVTQLKRERYEAEKLRQQVWLEMSSLRSLLDDFHAGQLEKLHDAPVGFLFNDQGAISPDEEPSPRASPSPDSKAKRGWKQLGWVTTMITQKKTVRFKDGHHPEGEEDVDDLSRSLLESPQQQEQHQQPQQEIPARRLASSHEPVKSAPTFVADPPGRAFGDDAKSPAHRLDAKPPANRSDARPPAYRSDSRSPSRPHHGSGDRPAYRSDSRSPSRPRHGSGGSKDRGKDRDRDRDRDRDKDRRRPPRPPPPPPSIRPALASADEDESAIRGRGVRKEAMFGARQFFPDWNDWKERE